MNDSKINAPFLQTSAPWEANEHLISKATVSCLIPNPALTSQLLPPLPCRHCTTHSTAQLSCRAGHQGMFVLPVARGPFPSLGSAQLDLTGQDFGSVQASDRQDCESAWFHCHHKAPRAVSQSQEDSAVPSAWGPMQWGKQVTAGQCLERPLPPTPQQNTASTALGDAPGDTELLSTISLEPEKPN